MPLSEKSSSTSRYVHVHGFHPELYSNRRPPPFFFCNCISTPRLTHPSLFAPNSAFKVVLVGDNGVGKTSLLKRLCENASPSTYVGMYPYYVSCVVSVLLSPSCTPLILLPYLHVLSQTATKGVNVYVVHLENGSKERVELHIYDTPGDSSDPSTVERYCEEPSAYILMFDVTSRLSYKNLPTWHQAISSMPNAKSIASNGVVLGNKIDCKEKDRRVKVKGIAFHRRKNLMYYDISAENNLNVDKAFVHLTRKLKNDAEGQWKVVTYPAISASSAFPFPRNLAHTPDSLIFGGPAPAPSAPPANIENSSTSSPSASFFAPTPTSIHTPPFKGTAPQENNSKGVGISYKFLPVTDESKNAAV